MYFDQGQNWSASQGLAFSVHSGQADQILHVDLYVEGTEGQESYIYELDLTPSMEEEWVQIGIPWDSFHRVDWEAAAGSPFTKSDQISGLAFGFGTDEGELEGELWIDELGWLEGKQTIADPVEENQVIQTESREETGAGRNLPCFGSLALPFGLAGFVLLRKKDL